jgi:hypothetical protein
MQRIGSFLRPFFVLAAAALALASGTEVEAQRIRVDSLSRVRVTQSAVDPDRFAATFLSSDSQVVVVRRGPAVMELPRGSVRRLEVSAGERSVEGGAWRGAKGGFLGGLIVGAVLGTVFAASIEDDDYFIEEAVAIGFVATGMTLGTVVGTVVGAAAPGERWVQVPLPPPPAVPVAPAAAVPAQP